MIPGCGNLLSRWVRSGCLATPSLAHLRPISPLPHLLFTQPLLPSLLRLPSSSPEMAAGNPPCTNVVQWPLCSSGRPAGVRAHRWTDLQRTGETTCTDGDGPQSRVAPRTIMDAAVAPLSMCCFLPSVDKLCTCCLLSLRQPRAGFYIPVASTMSVICYFIYRNSGVSIMFAFAKLKKGVGLQGGFDWMPNKLKKLNAPWSYLTELYATFDCKIWFMPIIADER